MSRSRDIGHLSLQNSEKMTYFLQTSSQPSKICSDLLEAKKKNMLSKAFFNTEYVFEVNFCQTMAGSPVLPHSYHAKIVSLA